MPAMGDIITARCNRIACGVIKYRQRDTLSYAKALRGVLIQGKDCPLGFAVRVEATRLFADAML